MANSSLLTKMNSIEKKINLLNAEKTKIEQQLSLELFQVLKKTDAVHIDFDMLIGGLLFVIKSIQSNSAENEVWQQAGKKFHQSKIKSKSTAAVMAEQNGTNQSPTV